MNWNALTPSSDGTHHLLGAMPAYEERFDEVLPFHAPGLAPVRRDGRAWHIDDRGRAAYPQRFTRTFGFYEGLAAVVGPDGWHHVAPDGHELTATRFEWCGNFQGGRCTVRDAQRRYTHIDREGRPAYDARWYYAGDFREGVAVVQAEDGRSTHVDAAGSLIHGHWFVDLDVFHKGFARARDDDGWTHVDRRGESAYTRRFAQVEPFYNGQARVERHDGGLEVIDLTGQTLVELRPARRSEFAALSSDMVGVWRTRAIAAAVTLSVPEALPGTIAEVASACGSHPDRTARLVRALGELHLVACHDDRWELTPRGRYLRRDHLLTLADAALEYDGPLDALWSTLPLAVRGADWSPPDVFGQVAADPDRVASHHRMLASYARHDYERVADALPLNGCETVVDAGGGVGVLAELLLLRHPGLRVLVLDRPEVVALAPPDAAADARVVRRPTELFQPWDVTGDVVVMGRVLHDWDDAAATTLLHHARAALRPGGRLFIIEMVLPEHGVAGALCDLHLLMATGGRERSLSAYTALLDAAGLDLESVRRLSALPSVLVGVAR